jgi:hypothetical protein
MQDATILSPARIEAESFTDANAAATRLEEINRLAVRAP